MTSNFFTFLSAGEIVFGEDALLQLKTKCHALGITKPMVVTTGLKRTDIIPRIKEILANCVVYDKVSPEPRSSQALECLELAKSNGCNGFIGVGGGSPMDLAKVTAVLAAHGGAPRDYIGENNVPGPVAPIVAVPTTAGSGSEVTSVASLAHDEKGDYFKAGLSDNHLRQKVAIVDLRDEPAPAAGHVEREIFHLFSATHFRGLPHRRVHHGCHRLDPPDPQGNRLRMPQGIDQGRKGTVAQR